MKRIITLFAATALVASVAAQTVTESKGRDNWYIGINGGMATKATGHAWLKGMQPNVGLRVGRNFTPVFGLAVESNAYFKSTDGTTTGTAVNALNTSMLGTVNLSNWFGGYPGEPRPFEIVALYGVGWGHVFGSPSEDYSNTRDVMTSKAGLDFVFNLGRSKAWQFYVEPAMVWSLGGSDYNPGIQYNLNHSAFQVNVGLIYKLGNSNGTHNFTVAEIRDQSEIDALNERINDMRGSMEGMSAKLAAKDRQINELNNALDECNRKPKYVKPATATNLQPTVLFRQGKSVIDPAQYAPIELIAQYMRNHPEAKVEIIGYASPEGTAEFNQRLSEQRAEAVKKALVKKYKISSDRLTTKGKGATDELFEQVEFNRVATFNDNAK